MKPPATEEYGPAARLPVASAATVRGYARELGRRHRLRFAEVVVLHSVATLAGLVGPWVLGSLVQSLSAGTVEGRITAAVGWYLAALLVQSVFLGVARQRGGTLGELILADLREDFLVRSVALPTGLLERAGTGDLVSRGTTDIDRLATSVREAVPELAVAAVSLVLMLGALTVTSPLLAATALIGLPLLLLTSRWYFRRAPHSYRSEAAAYAAASSALAETVDAGRTVEALRLGPERVALTDRRLGDWVAWSRYTMWLRTVWFPSVDATYGLGLLATLLVGGLYTLWGWIDAGQLTTGVLYAQAVMGPVDQLLRWYDELQIGQASLARLVGVREVPDQETDPHAHPVDRQMAASQVGFGYHEGVDVLHGISLDVAPGSRVALVGPSGAGKSTLGRLLAGIYAPGRGSVTLGGAALARMPAERVRAQVALVNQEHHVFVGTLRDNLRLARPDADDTALHAALAAVDATGWVAALGEGLDTEVGSGGVPLTPPQAQQVALARLVLADPHTLVLDEATSLLDPRAARHLERSLAKVLAGRTVIAIAHRLHTAHDADVIAVVEDGRISEYGSHPELVAADGPYAALWRSWRDER